MGNWQKVGGFAAVFEAFAYIVGFSFMLAVLQPALQAHSTPVQQLGQILGMTALVKSWNVIIYILFGAALVPLVVALHARLSDGAPFLMRCATAFGLIWSGLVIATGMISNVGLGVVGRMFVDNPNEATLVWQTLNAAQEGLGGGVELVGGLWVLLVSGGALRLNALPKLLNYVGVVTGICGILTVLPPLADAGAVFGLGQIVWFAWLGMVMLSRAEHRVAAFYKQPSNFDTDG